MSGERIELLFADAVPEARIERIGRWSYSVTVTQGIGHLYYGHRLGRRRAEATARRRIAKAQAWNARESWTVR